MDRMIRRAPVAAAVSVLAAALVATALSVSAQSDVQTAVNAAFAKFKDLKEGRTRITSRCWPRSTPICLASRS